MLTAGLLRGVPLFAQLPLREIEFLSNCAADIRLGVGEYAANEGESRALYAVLGGEIEVTKRFDGVERRIGGRMPGTLFGEVSIALGDAFLGSYRAVKPSRVVRVVPHPCHNVAAAVPRLAEVILVKRDVLGIDACRREVQLDGGEFIAAGSLIIASGVSWRRLDIEGFDRLVGKGISHGASRSEAGNTQGVDIHLIGAGNPAGQAALFFANHAGSVTLLVRSDSLDTGMSRDPIEQLRGKPNIGVELRAQVRALHGQTHLSAIDVFDSGSGGTRRCAATGCSSSSARTRRPTGCHARSPMTRAAMC